MTKATYEKESFVWITIQRDKSIMGGRHSSKALWQEQKAELTSLLQVQSRQSELEVATGFLISKCVSNDILSLVRGLHILNPAKQCHPMWSKHSNIRYLMSSSMGDITIPSTAAA